MRHVNPWTVFTDVFSLVLMTFLLMICALILLPQTIQSKDKDYHPKAEYMIVLDWNDKSNVDLDLWLRNPEGELVWYMNKEVSNISLDRDSRGFISNRTMVDGKPVDSGNEEITTIRAVLSGDYDVGVAYYSSGTGWNREDPVEYTIKLIKINPTLTVLKEYKGQLNHVKDMDKPITFHIDEDQSVTILPNNGEPFLRPGQIP